VHRSLAASPHFVLQPFDLVAQLRDPTFALHPLAPVAQIVAEPMNLVAHVLAAMIVRCGTASTRLPAAARTARMTRAAARVRRIACAARASVACAGTVRRRSRVGVRAHFVAQLRDFGL
jgi:hypothetical protein